jgi:hypothetical protein
MSLWDKLFGGGGQDPSAAANKYLDKIPGVSHDIYDPYINRGGAAGDVLSEQYGKMSQDPSAFIDALMKGYKPSEGYQFKQDQMGRAAANTAAAGGMRGTAQDQMHQQQLTQGLLGQDMQQYLSNALGVHGQGLQGEQGLYGIGFGASQGLDSDLTNVLGQQGGMAYQQAREDRNRPGWLSKIAGGIGTIAGLPTSGGGSIGGDFLKKFF